MDKSIFTKPHILLATWFGSGFLPKAPGTWGSIAALPPGLLLLTLGGTTALFFGIVIVTALGFWAAKKFDEEYNTHDSKMIVIDEVAGQWIAMIPAGLNPVLIVLSFLLFRLFDVTKPWPISMIDKQVKGPLGVMGDDLLAGIFAALCLYGAAYAGFI